MFAQIAISDQAHEPSIHRRNTNPIPLPDRWCNRPADLLRDNCVIPSDSQRPRTSKEVLVSNKDLLDLCRLNLMEENIKGSPAVDRDVTLKAIDYAKRQLAIKIGPGEETPDAKERHKERQKTYYSAPENDTQPRRLSGSGICPHDIECAFTDWPVRREWDNKYCTCRYRDELKALEQKS